MIHVVARSNELQNSYFREIPNWLRDVAVLACCLLVSGLFRLIPDFARYTATIAGLIGLIGVVSIVLFLQRVWVRPVLYEFAIATTFTVVTSTNYVREGSQAQGEPRRSLASSSRAKSSIVSWRGRTS